jgi:hypothetical protein
MGAQVAAELFWAYPSLYALLLDLAVAHQYDGQGFVHYPFCGFLQGVSHYLFCLAELKPP